MVGVQVGVDVTFRAARTVPADVRRLVKARLVDWELGGLVDDVALIASELVTNAVRHAPGPEVRVRVVREPSGVLVEVWDSSVELPVIAGGVLRAGTGGRGLALVKALASECGVSLAELHGKWAWARVQK